MSVGNPRVGPFVNRRRSQRILLSIAVQVSATNGAGETICEETKTEVVNCNGGLVLLKQTVHETQRVKMKNVLTGEDATCVVVSVAPSQHGGNEVAIEFEQPNPRFWRVSFPPQDWNPRAPEAKRFRSDSNSNGLLSSAAKNK